MEKERDSVSRCLESLIYVYQTSDLFTVNVRAFVGPSEEYIKGRLAYSNLDKHWNIVSFVRQLYLIAVVCCSRNYVESYYDCSLFQTSVSCVYIRIYERLANFHITLILI